MVRRSVAMAGFSVGELTALIASGAISLEEGKTDMT
jgi:malonyl CoA-acyl carrier protein transacylase